MFRQIRDGVHWVDNPINHATNTIAQVRRPEQRQHQIRAGTRAVNRQSLPHILIMEFKAVRGCHIKQAAYTQDGVHKETTEGNLRTVWLALQKVVDHCQRQCQMVDEIADHRFHRTRGQISVDHGGRPNQRGIHRIVERKDMPVDRLKRIEHLVRAICGATAKHTTNSRDQQAAPHYSLQRFEPSHSHITF